MKTAPASTTALTLMVLALSACGERTPCDDEASWEAIASVARTASDARAAEVTLVPVPPGARLAPRTPNLARLVIDTGRVDMDLAPVAPRAFPSGTARERMLSLPAPITTLYRISGGMLALPGEPYEQHELLPTLALRLSDLAHIDLLVSGDVRADTLAEAIGALSDQAGTERADLVLGDGTAVAPLAVHRLYHDLGVARFHDPLGDARGLELVRHEDGGITLRTGSGAIGPSCGEPVADHAFVSVPARAGALDAEALTACLEQLRVTSGSLRFAYVLSDDASVADLVPALAAVHAAHLEGLLVRYGLARPAVLPDPAP